MLPIVSTVEIDREEARPPRRAEVPIGTTFSTDVPARLDRLGWSAWHRRVVVALGITWILDGLEATLISAIGPVLERPETLGLTASQVGLANGCYLAGEVVGALLFGHLTDTRGRKKLFLVTLALYLVSTALSGLATNLVVFALFRMLAGAGIGGEYAAINSAIDELIPARLRGQIDLTINGSYWIGAAAGAAMTVVLLNPAVLPHSIGWRLVFGLGSVLGLCVVLVRRDVPESPRWLLMQGKVGEAQATVDAIEAAVLRGSPAGTVLAPAAAGRYTAKGSVGFLYLARDLLQRHRRRTTLGLALIIAQAFFYNAIFFTYGAILMHFYGVREERVGLYLIPFAVGNFLGPALFGRLFDTVGRRAMITATYGLSGVMLLATGYAFAHGWLTATTQVVSWCCVFFFASSAASSGYLTVSELFPVEIRGKAIAMFFAVGTAASTIAPVWFSRLVEQSSREHTRGPLFGGYVAAAVLMIVAAVVAALLAENAEGKSLEALADAEGTSKDDTGRDA
jgi:MFS family permease